ncbi:MAG: Cohesin protein [Candidatus Levybacteria bacterium]|nr:Cohesin protein [Candidatus Levybacteria bacterium]
MSKRTLFLIFALFLITLALLLVALYQPQTPKTAQIVTPTKEPVAQTILSFGIPVIATSSSAVTLDYFLPINISTGKNNVTAVQLELQYDPLILTDVAVAPGPFFPTPEVLLNQIDTKTGRISYAIGVGLTGSGVVGKGIVANLTFSVKAASAPEKTAILFLPKTLVTAEEVSESVRKPTANGIFTVGEKPSTPSAASQ